MQIIDFTFQLFKKEERFFIHFSVDGSDPQTGTFDFDLDPMSRISQVIREIELNNCSMDDLRDVGSNLWIALTENELGNFFDEKRSQAEVSGVHTIFRLNLPAELEKLPWETLYDEKKSSFLACNPGISIIRTPPSSVYSIPNEDPEPEILRILAVVPEGSGLQYEHELNNLKNFAEKASNSIYLDVLEGRVDPDRIVEKLRSRSWDILHYIGHGEVDETDTVRIRLNKSGSSDDHWLEAEAFAEMFRRGSVRLAVLNCCLGATPNSARTLSGLGPYLLRAGVPSVVAMRYEITDDVAIKFSSELYHKLLNDRDTGRIDIAVQHARQSLWLNSTDSKIRSFITPIIYVTKGNEQLFDFCGKPVPRIIHQIPEPRIPENIPDDIISVFKEGLCIPLIGPEIISGAKIRRSVPTPDPVQLTEQLAQDSNYPRMGDFTAAESTDGWIKSMLFPYVCQHYQYTNKRYQLVRALQNVYIDAPIPQSLLNIASWKVPGIIYTYFDGLMEEALSQKNKLIRTLFNLTEELDSDADVPLLVLIRGSFTNPSSLILTEDDHDRLWHDMGKMNSHINRLTREEPGRSLLLMGVNPRDPIIRRLCTQLLDSGQTRNQGPTFFVYSGHTKADQAYWEKFDVFWIDTDINDFIWSLSNIAPGDPS